MTLEKYLCTAALTILLLPALTGCARDGWPEYAPEDPYSLKEGAAHPRAEYFPSPGDWRNEVLYQIITDRFDNGDPANDDAHPRGRVTPGERGGIHGGDFRGLERRLDYLKELGVTAVWISPVVLNSHGQYHGYHAFDFARIDPHWGTLADLRSMVDAAHARDLRVFIDVVCNHTANLIEPEVAGRPSWLPPPDTYKLRWRDPDLRYPPPFDDLNLFHAHGPIDYGDPRSVVLGELYNLDDIKTELPEMRRYLADVMKDLITATDCDGFRVDTTKHVEPEFWDEWNREIERHAASLGKENFFIFGEAWIGDVEPLRRFLVGEEGAPVYDSLLDFPMRGAIENVFARGDAGPAALRDVDLRSREILPPHAWNKMTRFIDNHDMRRFLTVAEESHPNRDERLGRLKMAMTFLLTGGGVPVIYYGTEQGFEGGSASWDSSREDMFDGEFEFGPSGGDNFDATSKTFAFARELLELRKNHEALRTGELSWLFAADKPGLLAFTRSAGDETMAIFMNTSAREAIEVPDKYLPSEMATAQHRILFAEKTNADIWPMLPPGAIAIVSIPSSANPAPE